MAQMVKKGIIENSDNNSKEFSKGQFGKTKEANNRIVHKKKDSKSIEKIVKQEEVDKLQAVQNKLDRRIQNLRSQAGL